MEVKELSVEDLEVMVKRRDGAAICELAYRCRTGTGGAQKNLTRAYQLYHKAEKMQLPEAYKAYYEMYRDGEGVAQNPKLANEYLAKYNDLMGITETVFVASDEITEQNIVSSIPQIAIAQEPVAEPAAAQASQPLESQFTHTNETVHETKPMVNTMILAKKINEAEMNRNADNFNEAKSICNEILRAIERVRNGEASVTGGADINDIEIETYWILTFVAFNEQRYNEMYSYFDMPGVKQEHPWGFFLKTVSHLVSGSSALELENDLQDMLTVEDSPLLSETQKSDLLERIADLYVEGYGQEDGNTVLLAKQYYEKAKELGSEYAEQELRKFKKSLTGKVTYVN